MRLGLEVNYLTSLRGEKTPDYECDGMLLEVGGMGKSRTQFKGFSGKRKLVLTHPGRIGLDYRPLYFLGCCENE